MIQPCFLDFLANNQVGITQAIELLVGDFTQDADGQTRPREGMAAHDLLGETEAAAHLAHFILEQLAQGLHQLELQVFGKTAHVVVTFDLHGNSFARLGVHVGDKRVLLALSGGVDSSTLAFLLKKAIGDQLTCMFIDQGFMRKGEPEFLMLSLIHISEPTRPY